MLRLQSHRDERSAPNCAGPDNADNASALSGFRIWPPAINGRSEQFAPIAPPSYPQGAPETLPSLNYHHCSAVDARHAGGRLGGAQRAWSRVRTPPGAPVSPRAPRRPSVFSDLRRRESHNALPEGSPGAADLPNALRPARALPPWPPSYQRQRRFPSVTLEVAAMLFAPARCPPGATVDLARRCGAAESRGRSTRPRGRLPASQPAMPPGSPSTARGWRRRPDARSRR